MKTQGSLCLKGEVWEMRANPHVIERAKRVFKHLGRAAKVLKFSNTPEHCFELGWFTQRFPLDIEPRSELDRQAGLFESRQVELDLIDSPEYQPRPVQFSGYAARDYQARASEVYLKTGGLLIGDDVGLGKTVTFLCSLTDPSTLPAVAVVLAHLPGQWKDQIAKFLPALAVHIIAKGSLYQLPDMLKCPCCGLYGLERTNPRPKVRCKSCAKYITLSEVEHTARPPDVLIVSYAKLSGWHGFLGEYCSSVVFDEVQELRRRYSKARMMTNKYEAAYELSRTVKRRMGLSATPIYNYGGEMFNVMDILVPDCLGTKSEFNNAWCEDDISIKNPAAFGSWLREQRLMIRRTKQEVGRELPAETRITHTVSSDHHAFDNATDRASELARVILADTKDRVRGESMQATAEFDALMRQATGIAKAPYVAAFVEMLLEGETPVVLFGWHHAVYEIWRERLAHHNPQLYTGQQSATGKRQAAERFIKGQSNLFICSLWSGAGLDGLQNRCSTVVFGELDWSPGRHEQCVGRVLRDGQPDPVTAFFLVCEDGADPFMCQVLGLKQDQSRKIVDPSATHGAEPLSGREKTLIPELAKSFLAKRR